MAPITLAEQTREAAIAKEAIKLACRIIFHKDMPVPAVRLLTETLSKFVTIPKGAYRSTVNIQGIECDWWTPATHIPGRVLFYSHGGGYALFSKNTHKGLVARLATEFKAQAFSFNYKLAPEHAFPAPIKDGIMLYKYLIQKGILNPQKTIFAGDSAGGGLTMALMLAMKDEQLPLPRAAVLFSPFVDLSAASESVTQNANTDVMLSQAVLQRFSSAYLGHNEAHHPYASPIFADCKGLPPVFIQCVSDEILKDDSTRLAETLDKASVPNRLEIWKGLFHVFQIAWPYIAEAEHAIIRAGDFVHEVFEGNFHG